MARPVFAHARWRICVWALRCAWRGRDVPHAVKFAERHARAFISVVGPCLFHDVKEVHTQLHVRCKHVLADGAQGASQPITFEVDVRMGVGANLPASLFCAA